MKLLVQEVGSDAASHLAGEASEVASASIGYVETRSALARAARDGRLPGAHLREARRELELTWEELNVVDLDSRILATAGDATDAFALSAGDAIHLASALMLDDSDLLFATWDDKLGQAARDSGLAVAP